MLINSAHILVAFKVFFTHALMLDLFFFFKVLTCYNPWSYPMTSFLFSCAIEECIRNFPYLFFSAFRMQAGSVRLLRAHAFDALFVCVFYSNLRAVQSVTICLHVCLVFALLVCLFFDSTNSERCFAILRANTNYNFLIYGNDFTQIQEIRSHCRRRLF